MAEPDPLLDAAAALLARGAPLSVAAVAAEAGVSRGTVYRRFADRDAIVAALAASGRSPPAPEPPLRERILDAVGRLLPRVGLAATTLEGVAKEAGVGVVSVYRQFGDRKGLLGAFIAERTPRRTVAALPLDTPPEAGLLLLARESLAFLREHRALFLLAFDPDPETRALLAELRAGSPSVREGTARFVEQHFPDPTGRSVAAFWGLTMSVGWFGKGEVEADARFVVQAFLHGVASATEAP